MGYPGKQSVGSDYADAQINLSPRWAHLTAGTFSQVVATLLLLIYSKSPKISITLFQTIFG